MYEVFINHGWLYPGLQVPDKHRKGLLILGPDPGPEVIIDAVRDMLKGPPPSHIQLGKAGEAEKAWKLLSDAFEEQVAYGGYVSNAKGELLMIRRKGLWDIPKGKPEAGETPEQTALREVEEETAVKPLELKAWHGLTWHIFERGGRIFLKKNVWYIMMSSYTGQLQPQLEESITEARWVSREEYPEMRKKIYPSLLRLTDQYWEKMLIDH